jgi:hypothetical protein
MEVSRRSAIVNLTLIGLPFATIAAANVIPEGTEMTRNLYQDRTSCERDYSAQRCSPISGAGSGSTYIGGWYGPFYSGNPAQAANGDPGPGRVGLQSSRTTSIRGGFGSFGRAVHAVG